MKVTIFRIGLLKASISKKASKSESIGPSEKLSSRSYAVFAKMEKIQVINR